MTGIMGKNTILGSGWPSFGVKECVVCNISKAERLFAGRTHAALSLPRFFTIRLAKGTFAINDADAFSLSNFRQFLLPEQ
jgi:hypothetical protein